jgi:hypothetical protein
MVMLILEFGINMIMLILFTLYRVSIDAHDYVDTIRIMTGFRSDFTDGVCIMITFVIDVRDCVDCVRSKTGFGTDLRDSVSDIRIMKWLGM